MPWEFDASSPLLLHQRPRHDPNDPNDPNFNGTPPPSMSTWNPAPSGSSGPSGSGASSSSSNPTDTNSSNPSQSSAVSFSTTLVPVATITETSTTFTSFSVSTIPSTSSPSTTSASTSSINTSTTSSTFSTTASAALSSSSFAPAVNAVCIGDGLDAAAVGLLSAVIVPTAIGLVIWLAFAIVRPRFRQVYALREWFVQQDLRPKPVGSGFFSFLFPKVPLVPPVPDDVSNAGRSASQDAKLFPSDEELSQRSLWIALLIVFSWSILALAGGLPLYLINMPCNSDLPSGSVFGQGGYNTLTDLSFLRLLRVLDDGPVNTVELESIHKRALIGPDDPFRVRVRIVVLTILVIVLGILPTLRKIIREFNNVLEYRKRWLETKCQGKDLAWLSATKARGFKNWGEKQFKDYLVHIGLSSTLGETPRRGGNSRNRGKDRRNRLEEEEMPLNNEEIQNTEIDVQTLFSIGDTHRLALLIDERDEILENLEIAETKYISSFRVSTPDPSVLDFTPAPPPKDNDRPYISRPLPLAPQARRPRPRRHTNRALASSSLGPSSFVAPSSYYKLRGVSGISGGRFGGTNDRHQSLSDSFNSRIIGSRFMEVNRNSVTYGRLPLGSHVAVEKSGELGPVDHDNWLPPIPDPHLYGPNYSDIYENGPVDEHGVMTIPEREEEWVDISTDGPEGPLDTDFNGIPPGSSGAASFLRRPRPPKEPVPSTRRETFPLRKNENGQSDYVPPPHLRLQPSQPFVRPVDGLGYDDLGEVYTEITQWRSRLKAINAEIADAQRECYNNIASGTNITGWLMVGRGLRHIPGVEIIEGRAKEDIRWDVLQNERSWLDTSAMVTVVLFVIVVLAATLTAAAGLAVAPTPDVAHFLPFFRPLLTANKIAAGVATILAPAVAATIFIYLGLAAIVWVTRVHGSISISGNQLLTFKITFYVLTIVGCMWLVAVGAILFSMESLNTDATPTRSIANGSIYMSILALTIVLNVAIIFPGCLLLQPFRLWNVRRAEKQAVTPRQRFRAVYPRSYDPTYAIGACILAIVFASTFALLFPLIAPAIFILLLLTLIAHRYLVGYVYARTHSQTGGLLQLWLLRRFGTLLSMQPILLGLALLSRRIFIEGGILVGAGVFVIVFVEAYTSWKMRLPGRKSLSAITQNSLATFESGADRYLNTDTDTTNGSSLPGGVRTRGSMASVLEMMSVTLAVMPSSSTYKGAVPLQTETLDDLLATERAARTHPDAPPHLPPLPFTDHAEDMAGILYAPELIAPQPIIWLPNDRAGVAKSEAVDLQKYHNLQVTLDVSTTEDVLPRRSSSSRRQVS